MKNLTAIIEQAEEGGYFACCPEISGANGQGETIEECFGDLQFAIQLIFKELREQAIASISYNSKYLIAERCTYFANRRTRN
ncbi:MAG: type II toxin-antitoxin system HicB family antitoxin [Pseudanabaena sp. ELA645]|jgi:predicted RNase H-like HicB family nuclease